MSQLHLQGEFWFGKVGKRERKRAFLENGGLVLEKLVASCNGRPIPIRTFSYKELILATNNFDPSLILGQGLGHYILYKGSFEGRIRFIKRYFTFFKRFALTDIGISAKTSAHKNILKLVGCCLETSCPILVYEYAQNGVLADQIYLSQRQGSPMEWQSRLKIARQIAHIIAYLHTAFSRPIIHRGITLESFFLDQHDVPKLEDFSRSITIPEDKTHVKVDQVSGIAGFLCPSYWTTKIVTEKTDVYSFGMIILQLLTGHDASALLSLVSENNDMCGNSFERQKKLMDYFRNSAIDEIGDPAILAEGGVGVELQLQAVQQLGLTCIEGDPKIRPTMVDVTKELRRIEKLIA
ncbi:non-functional pseudokinase ZRK2-like [Corylus avellana]|uniref:non-functional pseudokinase ZRK2-like n=1 Tax=Corylus avellana TaxID=13451 RepID=UPI001E21AC49|nr:non-functional pseudokinase ZRK2-like [Corylus avellana]